MQHIISSNDKQSKRTHWVSLSIDKNTVFYFDSFGIEYTPQERSITHRMFKIQYDDCIMYEFYFTVFVECIFFWWLSKEWQDNI